MSIKHSKQTAGHLVLMFFFKIGQAYNHIITKRLKRLSFVKIHVTRLFDNFKNSSISKTILRAENAVRKYKCIQRFDFGVHFHVHKGFILDLYKNYYFLFFIFFIFVWKG